MTRLAIAAVFALSALTLAGCVSPGPTGPAEESRESSQASVQDLTVRDVDNAYIFKSTFEGTELICLSKGNYGSTTCNWELWNKMREAK